MGRRGKRAKATEAAMRVFEQNCRDHDLSITPQRVAIYEELVSSTNHPSAVDIHNKVREYFSNISIDTVSRTLQTFQQIGLAKVLEISGDPKRFDSNLEPHHHFRCTRCGKIIDFRNESYDALEVPRDIADKYLVVDKKVHLEGLCDTCRTG
jgi:Fur family peroxide stress response transcriptional regulator